jgi:beta-1,4-mannosyltransferase
MIRYQSWRKSLSAHPDYSTNLIDRVIYFTSLVNAKGNNGIVGYYPAANGNPYQKILYRELPKRGLTALPINLDDLEVIDELAICFSGAVIHFHWLDSLAESKIGPEKQAKILAALLRYKSFGGKLIYTLHNVLPHQIYEDNSGSEEEYADALKLRKFFVEVADQVQLLNPASIESVNGLFSICEEKTAYVPHPSYSGYYVDCEDQASARYELGLDARQCVVLCFGAIQPRKGLEEVIAGLNSSGKETQENVTLLVHGRVSKENQGYFLRLFSGIYDRCNIVVNDREFSNDDVGIFCRAADFLMINSPHNLNSGTAHLGITFGLPILSTGGAYVEPIRESCVVDSNPSVLFERAWSIKNNPVKYKTLVEKSAQIFGKVHPDVVSEKFAAEVERLLLC